MIEQLRHAAWAALIGLVVFFSPVLLTDGSPAAWQLIVAVLVLIVCVGLPAAMQIRGGQKPGAQAYLETMITGASLGVLAFAHPLVPEVFTAPRRPQDDHMFPIWLALIAGAPIWWGAFAIRRRIGDLLRPQGPPQEHK